MFDYFLFILYCHQKKATVSNSVPSFHSLNEYSAVGIMEGLSIKQEVTQNQIWSVPSGSDSAAIITCRALEKVTLEFIFCG